MNLFLTAKYLYQIMAGESTVITSKVLFHRCSLPLQKTYTHHNKLIGEPLAGWYFPLSLKPLQASDPLKKIAFLFPTEHI